MMGAEVRPVTTGSGTLKDAVNEAMRDWVTNVETTHYLIGSVVGPYPFPQMIRDFQAVIGREARAQIVAQTGKLPEAVVACVGGASIGGGTMGVLHGAMTYLLQDPQGQVQETHSI